GLTVESNALLVHDQKMTRTAIMNLGPFASNRLHELDGHPVPRPRAASSDMRWINLDRRIDIIEVADPAAQIATFPLFTLFRLPTEPVRNDSIARLAAMPRGTGRKTRRDCSLVELGYTVRTRHTPQHGADLRPCCLELNAI